mgnify:CR=1 FL=1
MYKNTDYNEYSYDLIILIFMVVFSQPDGTPAISADDWFTLTVTGTVTDGSGTYAATLAEGSYIEHTSPTPIWYNNAQGGTLSGTSANGYSYGYIKDLLFTDQTKGLFIPSLLGGSDSTYIPDYLYSVNPTNQPTIWLHGGRWACALSAGAFSVSLNSPVSRVNSDYGARVCFI